MAEKKPKTLKRKQRLLEGMTIDDLLDGWTQCCFYMKNKRRLCNIGRSPGSMYCGNHRLTSDDIPARVLNDAKAVGSTEITRIPCPIDPSHTIFSHNVNAHIKVCNTGARNALMEKQPYFCKDCNTGYNVKCASPSPVNVDDLVRKVRNCYHTKVQPEMQEPTSQGTVSVPEADIMEAVGGTSTAFAKIRHARQNVCIVREMTAEGLISTDPHPSERRPTAYVELGAGKGMLGLAVKTAAGVSGSRLVMVERMGVHRKADKTLREKNDNSFVRVRMDIRDCLLSRLPGVSTLDAPGEKEGRVVLIAKHLCGLATDITLRSLSCFPVADDGSLPEDVQGVALATCCHHACSWEDYVAVDWLKDQGFTSDDFDLMRHWSGWAHTIKAGLRLPQLKDAKQQESSDEPDGEHEVEHSTNVTEGRSIPRPDISYSEMSEIGKMIKRILDQGRVEHLKNMGLHAVQRRYCDSELSPECYIVLASRKALTHK